MTNLRVFRGPVYRSGAFLLLGLVLILAVRLVSGGLASSERSVTFSPHLTWTTAKWGDPRTDAKAKDSAGKNKPSQDAGSMATVTTAIGARAVWKKKDSAGRAITGQGVTVALLDSGVNDSVAGLDDPGKVIYGPDLSLETNSRTCATGTPSATAPTWPASSPGATRSQSATRAYPSRLTPRSNSV